MGFNFPTNPTIDQVFPAPGGPTFRWNGYGWTQINTAPTTGIAEAPVDGINYVRKNAAWVTLPVDTASWASITGKPATFPPDAHSHDYASITGKPSTFPPTLPIASSGVTGLDAAQAAQDTAIGTKLNASAYTAADVLTKIKTVDGTTSGLDADLLDGNDSAFYATASSVTGKEPTIAAGTTAQYWRGDKSWQTLDKAAVGLANVDNTADSAKPVSTAQAAADALALPKAGGTMTGNLTVSPPSGDGVVAVDSAATLNSSFYITRGGLKRWEIRGNTTAESGSNNGTNLNIVSWNDAGSAAILTPFAITRSTGLTTVQQLTSTAKLTGNNGSAIPAGGNNAIGFLCTSTALFGVFFGSGAPTLTAAKGSLYLNSTSTTNVTRMYVNTDGAATWTGVNTVA